MMVSTRRMRRRLTLYRGERPERLDDLLRFGIRPNDPPLAPGWPSMAQLTMGKLSPALAVALHPRRFQQHVAEPGRTSPFVSFTDSLDVALRFALHDGERDEGLLITVTIEVIAEEGWQAIPRSGSGGLADSHGRRWICVPTCEFPNADAIVRRRTVEQFHANGTRDREYLLLGALPPDAFDVDYVTEEQPEVEQPAVRPRRSGWGLALAAGVAAGVVGALALRAISTRPTQPRTTRKAAPKRRQRAA